MGFLKRILQTGKLFLFCCMFLMGVNASTAFAERLAVAVPKANVRLGPGSQTKVLWQVEKYHPLLILEKDGDWYKFSDYEGDKGWIHSSLLFDQETVITKKENCNVRSGAGTGYQVMFRTVKGIPLKVLKREGSWIKVQHEDGDTGWIHKALVW